MSQPAETFRQIAEQALGLAVSVFTLCAEDVKQHQGNPQIARDLVKGEDPVVVGQALAFVCKLLALHMTPAEVREEKEALMDRVLGQ